PNQAITRAEFTVMLMNALPSDETGEELSFTDSEIIASWARPAVQQAVRRGIINGYEDGSFRANIAMLRSEMAVMIANALELSLVTNATTDFANNDDIPHWAIGAVATLYQHGLIEGQGN